jgi:hypothetical protein
LLFVAMAAVFKPAAARQAFRAVSQVTRPAAIRGAGRPALRINTRSLSTTPVRFDNVKDDPKLRAATTDAPAGESGDHEGSFARTDENVVIEYPKDHEMPRSPIVQGRGGLHFKRTLASFSLENKVSVVTGGARGLGLVMGQALVASGSDLAIVDLNSMFLRCGSGHPRRLMTVQRRKRKTRRRSWWHSSRRRTRD